MAIAVVDAGRVRMGVVPEASKHRYVLGPGTDISGHLALIRWADRPHDSRFGMRDSWVVVMNRVVHKQVDRAEPRRGALLARIRVVASASSRRVLTWRRATWLLVGTGLFWATLFFLWFFGPQGVALPTEDIGFMTYGHTGHLAAWLVGTSVSIAFAGIVWIFTLPPRHGPDA